MNWIGIVSIVATICVVGFSQWRYLNRASAAGLFDRERPNASARRLLLSTQIDPGLERARRLALGTWLAAGAVLIAVFALPGVFALRPGESLASMSAILPGLAVSSWLIAASWGWMLPSLRRRLAEAGRGGLFFFLAPWPVVFAALMTAAALFVAS